MIPLRPEDEAYADSMFLNANSKQAPQIVDRQVQPILDQSEIYSGCYGRVSITFYAYNSNGNKGVGPVKDPPLYKLVILFYVPDYSVFVGVSAPNIVTPEMVSSMNKDAILFAMANPVPEIMPDVAKAAGAKVVGTGRSDFPNQVNNVIAFPGIFRGALEAHATQITEEMKLAAAEALAALVSDEELNEDFIMPEAFDPRVAEVVSEAVKSHVR